MVPGGALSSLQEREFRLLWLGRVSSAVGDALVPVALVWAVLEIGGSATSLGAVLAAWTISRVGFTLVAGVIADRLPRRAVMLACDGVRAIVEAFTATMLLTGQMTLPLFFVTIGIFGAASAFFGPASTGIVPETVSRGRLQQANALLGLSQSTTSVFGPLAAGLIVSVAGAGYVFAIDAVTFAASAFFLMQLRLPERAVRPAQRFLDDLGEGYREVRSRPWLVASFAAFALTNLAFGAFLVLGPVIVRAQLGGSRDWGIVVTGGALGAVLGGTLALRGRPQRPLVACFGATIAVSLPLLALVRPLPVVAVAAAYAACLGAMALGTAIWEATLQERIPEHALSRVSSYDWLVSLVFMPIGLVAVGPLSAAVGLHTTLIGAAALVVFANLAVISVRSVRELEAEEAVERAHAIARAA